MNTPGSAHPTGATGSQQPRVASSSAQSPTGDGTRPPAPSSRQQAAPPSAAKPTKRADAPAPKARARHAHLFVTHVDPWSVAKNAFMLALALGVVIIVAVTLIWVMLTVSGTLESVTATVTDLAGGGEETLNTASLFSFSRVIGAASLLAILEVILLTALATLFAFLYNIAVGITGGLQVTLTDDS